jgi:hypothetical protein
MDQPREPVELTLSVAWIAVLMAVIVAILAVQFN